ncbi:hypothetical protein [Rhodococcus globerulus]|uniref:Transposase n=1 Tax=Rhodococcus globerulus TaxID=33008 RepID=A0ABU4C698_RHOGO|nr:hypothetical protein [Rhodococcus globerulus]MDV6271794.1 hypothetical protein [Rhodococcus globerulus]
MRARAGLSGAAQEEDCSYRNEAGKVAPNLLIRDFGADAPNRKWVTGVTEFRVGDQKLYLSPVLDLFEREDHRLLGWHLTERRRRGT